MNIEYTAKYTIRLAMGHWVNSSLEMIVKIISSDFCFIGTELMFTFVGTFYSFSIYGERMVAVVQHRAHTVQCKVLCGYIVHDVACAACGLSTVVIRMIEYVAFFINNFHCFFSFSDINNHGLLLIFLFALGRSRAHICSFSPVSQFILSIRPTQSRHTRIHGTRIQQST